MILRLLRRLRKCCRFRCYCKHTHVFRWKLPRSVEWYLHGENKRMLPKGFELVGCLLCGKVWCCHDSKATRE